MDDLIVFRKTYEYLIWLRPTVMRFARVYKYSLGIETEGGALELLRAIIRANYASDKETYIRQAVIEYETQRIFLRLAFEYKALSERQYLYGSGLLDVIGRLLRGWLKKYAAPVVPS